MSNYLPSKPEPQQSISSFMLLLVRMVIFSIFSLAGFDFVTGAITGSWLDTVLNVGLRVIVPVGVGIAVFGRLVGVVQRRRAAREHRARLDACLAKAASSYRTPCNPAAKRTIM
jgi:hypothetical protein